jgi:ubiquinol-cytochrome c reductase subunit 7
LSVSGLHHDDCYDEDIPDVKEALRRLPAHLVDERNFRIMRAMQLSIQKTILPKEEWVKFEEVSISFFLQAIYHPSKTRRV